MELKLYLRMLLRSWWIVALTALAAVTAALLNAYLATPQYSTQARFLISPSKLLSPADFTRILEGGNFVPTFAEIWNSNTAFDRTGEALQMAPSDLNDYSRSAVIAPSAQVIELTVTGPNPVQAALIANTLGAFAMADTNDNFGSVVSISVLDAAQAPRLDRPISPQPARDAGLALALGLVIGSVLAIGREQLRIPLEALRRRTTIDGESSAFNHAYFQRNLEDELARNRTGQVSLGLVQLAGLTDLYENMPPLVKQRLMQYVTKTLQKELRGSDSVGRWTDTSFGVLLPATPTQPAIRTLERIQRALTRPVEIDKGDRLDLNPYVGVAVVAGDQAATTLIAQAEAALNEARQSGQSLTLYSERVIAIPEPVVMAEPEPAAPLVITPAAVEAENNNGASIAEVAELARAHPEISESPSPDGSLPEPEIAEDQNVVAEPEPQPSDPDSEAEALSEDSPVTETVGDEDLVAELESPQRDTDDQEEALGEDSPVTETVGDEDLVAEPESLQRDTDDEAEAPDDEAEAVVEQADSQSAEPEPPQPEAAPESTEDVVATSEAAELEPIRLESNDAESEAEGLKSPNPKPPRTNRPHSRR